MNFDEKTIAYLQYYVYMLIDPRTKEVFYIGKGKGNRVFDHLDYALDNEDAESAKYDKIREIVASANQVEHIIVRHGLSENEAFLIEASLIDAAEFCGIRLTNLVAGHKHLEGLMSAGEIIQRYNAEPLQEMGEDCVLININKSYKRFSEDDAIYKATKEAWVISKWRQKRLKYALAEYRGIIVGVFQINEWYSVELPNRKRLRSGFNGEEAPQEVKELYLNKSVAHIKKKGAANPIRYSL